MKPPRHIQSHLFTAISRGGMIASQFSPLISSDTGLLKQFSLRRIKRILIYRIDLARRDLRKYIMHRIAELSLYDHLAVISDGYYPNSAQMRDIFPGRGLAVWKPDRIYRHMQYASVKYFLGRYLLFRKIIKIKHRITLLKKEAP